jgi:integrase
MPLLALYSGARLNELAPMCADDVKVDHSSGVQFMTVVEDEDAGRSVKTENSVRAFPIHPELTRIGFLEFVNQRRITNGSSARLFPQLTPGSKGGFGEAFSKWFGRYKRSLGIDNKNSVFHSFRHGFKDDMVRRFGFATLNTAVEKTEYPGLDLSALRWTSPSTSKLSR